MVVESSTLRHDLLDLGAGEAVGRRGEVLEVERGRVALMSLRSSLVGSR